MDRDELLSSYVSSEDKAAALALLEWAMGNPDLDVRWTTAADIDVPGRVSQLARVWPSGASATGDLEVRLQSLKDIDSSTWDAERCDQLIRRTEANTGLHFDNGRRWVQSANHATGRPHKRQSFLDIVEEVVRSLNLPA